MGVDTVVDSFKRFFEESKGVFQANCGADFFGVLRDRLDRIDLHGFSLESGPIRGEGADFLTLNMESREFLFGAMFFLGDFRGDGFRQQDSALTDITAGVAGNFDVHPTVFRIEKCKFVVGGGLEKQAGFLSRFGINGCARFCDGIRDFAGAPGCA